MESSRSELTGCNEVSRDATSQTTLTLIRICARLRPWVQGRMRRIRAEALDWLAEAEADLRHASHSYRLGSYNWACFAAEQAAEKALKAFLIGISRKRLFYVHDLTALHRQAVSTLRLPSVVTGRLAQLSAYYTASRYPNSGLRRPSISITSAEARTAINVARVVVKVVKRQFAKKG